MKKKKLILIAIILTAIIIVLLGIKYLYGGKEEVNQIADIFKEQHNLEQTYINDLNTSNYSFDNPKIILNPYGNSPLTAIIMFKTDEEKVVEIIVDGKDEKTTINNIFEKESTHLIPVYGLYADYDNKVTLKIDNQEKILSIKTDPLPEDFVLPTSVYADKNLVSDDLIFVSIALGGYTSAYDVNGDPRWYLIGNYAWDVGRLKNGRLMLSSNRPIAPPYHTVGLVEIDLTGKIYKEYVNPGGYHHDYFEMENGNLLVASNFFPLGTVEDFIVLIDRETGKVIKEWDLKNSLPTDEGKANMWSEYDWFHNNSVWYDKEKNSIILSGRHQDAVISIDYDTGKLNWIIGDNTNWSEEMQKYFFKTVGNDFEWQWAQHAAMVLPNGEIFILDNGNNRSKIKEEYFEATENYTRGVIYRINEENMTIEQTWQYGKERGSEFYSPYISDVDYYDYGHYLVHSGGIGSKDGKALNVPAPMIEGAVTKSVTVELLNNKKIFELQLPSNYYRAEKMSLYSENKFAFGEGKRLGTLGETESVKEKNNLLFVFDEIPEKYAIKFSQETDRLIFKSKLLEGTKVRIILDNLFDRKTYTITASNKAYTAMCIDIFNEEDNDNPEEININAYINNEGLKGTYNIYVKVNDELYNTKKYVTFVK